jgi:enoyl-[acyl-carrier protein] reductase III
MSNPLENRWALILGASSGFGEAAALELAAAGMNIFGVHLDKKSTATNAERIQSEICALGRQAFFFNVNAAAPEKREAVLDEISGVLGTQAEQSVTVFLHSLAFATLRPFTPDGEERPVGPEQMNMTMEVMSHSLVYWVQGLLQRKLLRTGSRIFAMTSSGGHRVWSSYGPVSAAKAALESHIRQLAFELASRGITANAIQAGVTDTPALKKIPGHEEMVRKALTFNPGGRLTEPRDIARALVALSHPFTSWLTGNVIRVDGGEDITG